MSRSAIACAGAVLCLGLAPPVEAVGKIQGISAHPDNVKVGETVDIDVLGVGTCDLTIQYETGQTQLFPGSVMPRSVTHAYTTAGAKELTASAPDCPADGVIQAEVTVREDPWGIGTMRGELGEWRPRDDTAMVAAQIAKLPDLVVCASPHQYVQVPGVGEIKVTVKNQGNAESPAAVLRFDIERRGVRYFEVAPLAPGAKATFTRRSHWYFRGEREFRTQVDPENLVAEGAYEGNNRFVGKFKKGFDPYFALPPVECAQ